MAKQRLGSGSLGTGLAVVCRMRERDVRVKKGIISKNCVFGKAGN